MKVRAMTLPDLEGLTPSDVRPLEVASLFDLYKRMRHSDAVALRPVLAGFVQDRLDTWDIAALAPQVRRRLRKRIRPGTLAAVHLPRLAAGLAGWTHPALPFPPTIPQRLPITRAPRTQEDLAAWFRPGYFQTDAPWEVWLKTYDLVKVGIFPPESLAAVEQVAYREGETESEVTTLAEADGPDVPIDHTIKSYVLFAHLGVFVWHPETQHVEVLDQAGWDGGAVPVYETTR